MPNEPTLTVPKPRTQPSIQLGRLSIDAAEHVIVQLTIALQSATIDILENRGFDDERIGESIREMQSLVEVTPKATPLTRLDLVDHLREILEKLETGSLLQLELAASSLISPDDSSACDSERMTSDDVLENEKSWLKEAIHRFLRVEAAGAQQTRHQARRNQQSMYEFAYGLSHEINNPLANIAARAKSLMRAVSNESDSRSLQTIFDQAMRAHEMLAEMMLAIQNPVSSFSRVNLREIAKSTARDWQDRIESRDIQLDELIDDENLWILGDSIAIKEMMGAGLRNAVEACRSGDSIQIIAERIEAHPESSDSTTIEVRLAIIDNGPGIPHSIQDKIWDVYYCGREAGRGLGIGLSKIRRIVENHRGRVWVESDEGKGFGLEMRFPWKKK